VESMTFLGSLVNLSFDISVRRAVGPCSAAEGFLPSKTKTAGGQFMKGVGTARPPGFTTTELRETRANGLLSPTLSSLGGGEGEGAGYRTGFP
jgi:hypothetical protein